MVMCFALPDQVAGQFALSQQRISGDVLAFDGDGIEQGDGHHDLVGSLDRFGVAFYWQGSRFFWV